MYIVSNSRPSRNWSKRLSQPAQLAPAVVSLFPVHPGAVATPLLVGATVDPVAKLDQIFQELLDRLTPGVQPGALGEWVDQCLSALVQNKEALNPTSVGGYLANLIDRLKSCGYTPRQPSVYLAQLQTMSQGALGIGKDAVPGADRFSIREGGIWDSQKGKKGGMICNFTLIFDVDTRIEDDLESSRVFEGDLVLNGISNRFKISSGDYAKSDKLLTHIYDVAGPGAQVYCDSGLLRTAISALSLGKTAPRRHTTNFGWTQDGGAYLVPGGSITASGLVPAQGPEDLQVHLEGEEQAKYLGMKPITDPVRLAKLKRHVVKDLLAVNSPTVTYSMLGAVGASILYRFAGEIGRPGVWLTGTTGTGKSYTAKLFMNFFGDYPITSGHFPSWGSTANYVQRQGYFFKDAMYLADDYKPEVVIHQQLVRILQSYSDGTSRGRLKVDATTNISRPIRGLLVSTGEDIPQHSASAIARSIIVPVPQIPKNLTIGDRCASKSQDYSGLTLDFIRSLLAQGRTAHFRRRVAALQKFYIKDILGQQNDMRIAANFALLAAGFWEMARYLQDVWPSWRIDARRFITVDLVQLRDNMLVEAVEQQPSEIFLDTLRDLISFGKVSIEGGMHTNNNPLAPQIGKVVQGKSNLWYINPRMAMEQVQRSLREQGRQPLKVSANALLEQLQQAGKLRDDKGNVYTGPVTAVNQGRPTIVGKRRRCFILEDKELI